MGEQYGERVRASLYGVWGRAPAANAGFVIFTELPRLRSIIQRDFVGVKNAALIMVPSGAAAPIPRHCISSFASPIYAVCVDSIFVALSIPFLRVYNEVG
jgi:hypothetical protein